MDIKKLYSRYLEYPRVSTDTRKILPDSIFFALKGDRFDANAFALSALEKGACCSVVDDVRVAIDDRFIVVDNVLDALQELARFHRNQLKIPIIGLTGSNGKTTTKELLAAVLSQKYNVLATKGNLNNHIGVPLTVLEINAATEVAVIEMGANHVGEIAMLCAIANPTHGLITNIGKAHIGTFGGFENIIRGKSELYQHLIDHNGVVFINSRNEILAAMAKRFASPMFYAAPGDFYQCELMEADPLLKIRADNGEVVQTNLVGKYNFENIASALCIGKYFEVSATLANKAVSQFVPGNMRSQLIRKNGNTIILDAYNANPSSMCAAIENFAEIEGENKVVILGDMFELEEDAAREHENIGHLLQQYSFQKVFLCGELMKAAQEVYPSAMIFENITSLGAYLKKEPLKDALILIKASRGIGLEAVLEFI